MSSTTRFFRTNLFLLIASVVLALSSVGSVAGARNAESGRESATAAAASAHVPLLWKVSDDDNSNYLLGSFHLLKPGDYPLSPDVEAALQASNSVMFEIDMSSVASPEAMALMMQYQMIGDGRTLSSVLPDETKQQLEVMLKASGATLAAVDPMDPWALSMGMVIGIMQAMGFTPEAGVDFHLTERAQALGKPTLALETIEEQLKLMDSQPMSEQIFGLNEFLDDPKQTVADLEELHQSWMKGDAEALEAGILAEMLEETPETYRILLIDRNLAWVPQLQALLDDRGVQDNTLVVVGAMHVIGKQGVVELLRDKGYRIERICSACATADR